MTTTDDRELHASYEIEILELLTRLAMPNEVLEHINYLLTQPYSAENLIALGVSSYAIYAFNKNLNDLDNALKWFLEAEKMGSLNAKIFLMGIYREMFSKTGSLEYHDLSVDCAKDIILNMNNYFNDEDVRTAKESLSALLEMQRLETQAKGRTMENRTEPVRLRWFVFGGFFIIIGLISRSLLNGAIGAELIGLYFLQKYSDPRSPSVWWLTWGGFLIISWLSSGYLPCGAFGAELIGLYFLQKYSSPRSPNIWWITWGIFCLIIWPTSGDHIYGLVGIGLIGIYFYKKYWH